MSTDSVVCPPVSSIPGFDLDGGGPADRGRERRDRLRDAALAGPAAVVDQPLDAAEREGLLAALASGGSIEQALELAGHVDVRRRALPGETTTAVVLGLALFSGQGYASVLAQTMPHLRGGTRLPGRTPTANALSKARVRLGEAPLRALFEQDAAVAPDPAGPGASMFGLTVTAFDGTCLELPGDPALIEEFGCPTGAPRPQARLVTLVTCGDRRIQAAEIGSYRTSEQVLVDRMTEALVPGTVNLADRNFFSMARWLRFAATGAHLVWRVKNGAKCLPARITTRLPDGSYLVRLRESDGMRTTRRKDTGEPAAPRLPDTLARIVEFDVRVTDARGRTRTSRIRLLTTLLDHQAYPAKDLARLYAERWQVEITYLRLKSTLRGDGTVLRGMSPELARQEIWALMTVYNMLCDLAAQAAALDGIDPDEISFVTILRLTRAHLGADLPCAGCGHRPGQPLEALTSAIADSPRNRTGRTRTSPRTAAERRTGHGRHATYTISIAESNLLKAD